MSEFFATRNEWLQLDDATTATRHGLLPSARAIAAPTWKQRHGCGPGGSSSPIFDACDGVIGAPCADTSQRPYAFTANGTTGYGNPLRSKSRYRIEFMN